jgi:lipoprotein NlpD
MMPQLCAHACESRARRLSRPLAAAVVALLLAACASRSPAPVEDRSARAAKPPPPAAAPAVAPPPAQVEPVRVPTYTVKRGDTLYQIALDNGLDYRELAAWNNIENIHVIRVGQVLRLAAPGDQGGVAAEGAGAGPGVTTAPLRTAPPVVPGDGRAAPPPQVAAQRNPDNYKSSPKILKEPYSEQALRDVQRLASASPNAGTGAAPAAEPPPVPVATPTIVARAEPRQEPKTEPRADAGTAAANEDEDAKLNWMWPAEGKIVTGFSDTANLKGIDIAGKSGQPVFASAAGRVVYAGSGLRGYGKLIIVKHNATYLSAYAHNKDILVKEGQQVTRGQKIAEMGNSDSDQVMLHFEIRKLGKPIDPLKFLPPA